jgi:pSer/pThr/pTyr-binding forkhead associated (FHA) protein
MAKLVVLTEGLTGLSYELKVDKTTIGRVEDNTFQIAHPSVSSHHGEVLLRGNDVVIKDLQSTNGTFVNGQQVSDEIVLKPGQIVRFGQVDVRLESGQAAGPGKKPIDSTMVVPKGVSLAQLEQGPQGGLDTSKGGFSKKKDKSKKIFIIAIIAFIVVVGGIFFFILSSIGH